jgi:hypothetical protein
VRDGARDRRRDRRFHLHRFNGGDGLSRQYVVTGRHVHRDESGEGRRHLGGIAELRLLAMDRLIFRGLVANTHGSVLTVQAAVDNSVPFFVHLAHGVHPQEERDTGS